MKLGDRARTVTVAAMLCLWLFSQAERVRSAEPKTQFFRSNQGVAQAGAFRLPERLSDPGALQWKTPVESGHSTPIIANGAAFLSTFDGARRRLAVLALRMADGTRLWERPLPEMAIEAFHRSTGSGVQATPACDGERLFVFFGSYGLLCLDLQGNLLWEQRMGPFQDEYGAGSSPVLAGNAVILQQDHDVDSFLMALDRRTGKILWRHARPDAVRSYSTPAVWNRAGKIELLVAGALELAGHDLSTGERLWWTHGLARIVIPAPVVAGDRIYMASWAPGGDAGRRLALDAWTTALGKWDKNGDGKLSRAEVESPDVLDRFYRMDRDQDGLLDALEWERHASVFKLAKNSVLALKPSVPRGELPESDRIWSHERGVPYVSSPLVHRGIFWMVKDGGIVTKIEADSGRLLQEERLPALGNYYASPLAADGKVYFASEQGVVTVVADTREWRVLSTHDLTEKIYATPVVWTDKLLVRTEKSVSVFAKPSFP